MGVIAHLFVPIEGARQTHPGEAHQVFRSGRRVNPLAFGFGEGIADHAPELDGAMGFGEGTAYKSMHDDGLTGRQKGVRRRRRFGRAGAAYEKREEKKAERFHPERLPRIELQEVLSTLI